MVDYLTRYSGLVPGDLDESISRHFLCPMKAAYVRLRQLVDAGVIFVGHGLKTDFEMMNLVVPPSQTLDTVDLFHTPGGRMLGLRFLAHHVCQLSMESRTLQDRHCSIEDARTALALVDKYRELKEKGELGRTTSRLYEVGYETQWEVP